MMMMTMMNMKRIEMNQHMTDTMVHMRKMKWGIVMMILIQFLMETPLLIGILIRLMLVNLINKYDRLPFKHEYNG